MVKKEREITKKKHESLTLASAFEMIYEKSCDSKLSRLRLPFLWFPCYRKDRNCVAIES